MKIHHIAIWTFRLEELREFYIRYFNGTSNEKYINPKKGFESYFIYFDDGAALELMSRTDVQNTPIEENKLGLTHFALSFQSKEDVLRTTEQLRSDGYTIAGGLRAMDISKASYSIRMAIEWNVYTGRKKPVMNRMLRLKRNGYYYAPSGKVMRKPSLNAAKTQI